MIFGVLATSAHAGSCPRHSKIYTVEFLATASGAHVESFEVARVLSLSSGVAEPAPVYVPDAFVSAARKRFAADRGCESAKEGKRKQCLTYYLYDPSQSTNASITPRICDPWLLREPNREGR
jgi:hypothetical protein